jgi:hypothetical protein
MTNEERMNMTTLMSAVELHVQANITNDDKTNASRDSSDGSSDGYNSTNENEMDICETDYDTLNAMTDTAGKDTNAVTSDTTQTTSTVPKRNYEVYFGLPYDINERLGRTDLPRYYISSETRSPQSIMKEIVELQRALREKREIEEETEISITFKKKEWKSLVTTLEKSARSLQKSTRTTKEALSTLKEHAAILEKSFKSTNETIAILKEKGVLDEVL